MSVGGMSVGGTRVGGMDVNVEVKVGMNGVDVNVEVAVGMNGVNVNVLVMVGKSVAVRVMVGARFVTFCKGMIVPGCGGIASPAFGTSILTHTYAKEKGP